MSTPSVKLPARACDVCQQITLSDAARTLLTDRVGPTEYFGQLLEQGLYRDAVRFIAHCLPKGSAVWWGCLCVWEAGRPELPAPEAAALQAALRWVQQPTEEHRRIAESAGKAAGAATAAGCLALAAFYSHGSLAPPDQPAVPPPDGLTANTVAGAVLLAAAAAPPKQTDERFRHFLSMAVEIANQRLVWQINRKETGIAPLS